MNSRILLLLLTALTLGLLALPATKEIARRWLHRLLCLALRWRSRPCSFDHARRTVVIAPHQDDATLGCGGYILRRRLEARPVEVLYITDGRASHPNHPTLAPTEIAAMRRLEAARAMRVLRLEQRRLQFLDAVDGTLAHLDAIAADALVTQLAAKFRELQPDEILLPCRHDGSSEHDATFRYVQRSLQLAGLAPRVLEYPIWSRLNPLLLLSPLIRSRIVWRSHFPGYEDQKCRAIACYASQVEPTPPWKRAVLPPAFVAFFSSREEFFFEPAPPSKSRA